MLRVGIDIGSTTAKAVAMDEQDKIIFSSYERHNARVGEVVGKLLGELARQTDAQDVHIAVTGSVGMGLADVLDAPFVQEVVAAANAVRHDGREVNSMIDIGGEDAKVVFFDKGQAHDLRMNGNCAGGTGAFIDQMAVLLNVKVDEMSQLALNASNVYAIASRCGVFSKTDVQNLIAKNVSREDICASVFHAVAVQTVVTLAHGADIKAPLLLCGGPLTFIPALRKAFMDYLNFSDADIVLPQHGALLPATGAALHAGGTPVRRLAELAERLKSPKRTVTVVSNGLAPIFGSDDEHRRWTERIARYALPKGELHEGRQEVCLGIDSGSTTTKIVLTDTGGRILYTFYRNNGGNPVKTVGDGLRMLDDECRRRGAVLDIVGSCSTGYGEDLIKAAYQLDNGVVETIAHYTAAERLDPDVSFILDIGGQDMKAIFVNHGIIDRIEINEACSSGCGSFIETFAKTLGYTTTDFAKAACRSLRPSDLGTRCTVFMNSKVKQVLREGATIDDIAAGLAYSVVRNCLYKVLKLRDTTALGKHIVVQGGTMRNDAVVRALELLTGCTVSRCDMPELMGAYGCALRAAARRHEPVSLESMLTGSAYTTRQLHCNGCSNQCLVMRYRFGSGKSYFSGNRCERVFTNGDSHKHGANTYQYKLAQLFDRAEAKKADGAEQAVGKKPLVVGIPRVLGMFEDFPFWHTLLSESGIEVRLSDPSRYDHYEHCARMVMADNICFPAKLVHSHVQQLIDSHVDRVFLPFVVYERGAGRESDSYNCPIVTGYSEVVKSVQQQGTPIDSPSISFRDPKLLERQCRDYLATLGVDGKTASEAFRKACRAQDEFVHNLAEHNKRVLEDAEAAGRPVLLLAGRPYHTDPLIQHKVSDMISAMGIDVITDDIVREDNDIKADDAHYLARWAYPNRIMKSAAWVSGRKDGEEIPFVEFTSFGCGPDAFMVDEVRDVLIRHGKPFTQLKLDDINNVGAMRLRVRSLIESLRMRQESHRKAEVKPEVNTAPVHDLRHKKILAPFFTPFISPLLPAIMKLAGYDLESLPMSDTESCDLGLRYANNEVCYPATLVVGDLVKAMKSGRYDPDNTVVAMTQTGGQCRASNYVGLIERAMVAAGFPNTSVLHVTFGSNDTTGNKSEGLEINWLKMMPVAVRSILFADCMAKFYHATLPREKFAGEADSLKDTYLKRASDLIAAGQSKKLFGLLSEAATDFGNACKDVACPRVGVVGEIFLKFNPFAHKNLTSRLAERGIEVVPSSLADFFLQNFVNSKVRDESNIEKRSVPGAVYSLAWKLMRKQIDRINAIGSRFPWFLPMHDIFDEADEARKVINLNAQFGEGWLLPAEVIGCVRNGVNHVVSLQPFGCIANHIVSKGIEKRLKKLLPQLNMLSLDFDSGVSDVNIVNRLMLFVNNLEQNAAAEAGLKAQAVSA